MTNIVKIETICDELKISRRGPRTAKPDDLQKVTPSAKAKTHYVIVDAIGVTKSLKTASQPLDTKPSIPLKDLAMGIMMGAARDIDSVSSLAGRLSRIDHQIDDTQRAKVEEVAGQPLRNIIKTFFDSVDADAVMKDANSHHADAPWQAQERSAAKQPCLHFLE
ncbi:hypothetical protein [Tritonibacter mobilis]|uniref:hypothetical protein n=1 Tax=Tritonibacter mobilis TaxID=379347 RepID=UPI000806CABD|nr:hypothetical protein [Tritonibacter mobilis]